MRATSLHGFAKGRHSTVESRRRSQHVLLIIICIPNKNKHMPMKHASASWLYFLQKSLILIAPLFSCFHSARFEAGILNISERISPPNKSNYPGNEKSVNICPSGRRCAFLVHLSIKVRMSVIRTKHAISRKTCNLMTQKDLLLCVWGSCV